MHCQINARQTLCKPPQQILACDVVRAAHTPAEAEATDRPRSTSTCYISSPVTASPHSRSPLYMTRLTPWGAGPQQPTPPHAPPTMLCPEKCHERAAGWQSTAQERPSSTPQPSGPHKNTVLNTVHCHSCWQQKKRHDASTTDAGQHPMVLNTIEVLCTPQTATAVAPGV